MLVVAGVFRDRRGVVEVGGLVGPGAAAEQADAERDGGEQGGAEQQVQGEAADEVVDATPALAGRVAQHDVDGRPDHAGERVPHQEGPVGHARGARQAGRSEEHTSELQSRVELVCRLLLEKKKNKNNNTKNKKKKKKKKKENKKIKKR